MMRRSIRAPALQRQARRIRRRRMTRRRSILAVGALLLAPLVCARGGGAAAAQGKAAPAAGPATVSRAAFGQTADGTAVESFTLRNAHGLEIKAITLGAILT